MVQWPESSRLYERASLFITQENLLPLDPFQLLEKIVQNINQEHVCSNFIGGERFLIFIQKACKSKFLFSFCIPSAAVTE
jgi:hypothetical protein